KSKETSSSTVRSVAFPAASDMETLTAAAPSGSSPRATYEKRCCPADDDSTSSARPSRVTTGGTGSASATATSTSRDAPFATTDGPSAEMSENEGGVKSSAVVPSASSRATLPATSTAVTDTAATPSGSAPVAR